MARHTELYERLEIAQDADEAAIKKAYRKLAMKFHPDKNAGDASAAEKFKEISEAYEILSDGEKRAAYDRFGMDAFKEGGAHGSRGGFGVSPEDLFASFFGGFGGMGGGGGGRARGPRKTRDIVTALPVTLEECFVGAVRKMKVTRKVLCKGCKGSGSKTGRAATCTACQGQGVRVVLRQIGPGMITKQQMVCDQCRGEGETVRAQDRCSECAGERLKEEQKVLKVEIDKGARDGQKIVFRGESDEAPGAQAGDLIFVLKEREHATFVRKGPHLFMKKEVPLAAALCGLEFLVPHLDGRTLLVATGPGDVIAPGVLKEVRNEGMPLAGRPYEHGALYIEFDVAFPEHLGPDAVRALRAALGAEHDLPPVDPAAKVDAAPVSLLPADPEHIAFDEGRPQGAHEASDDEEGPQGVQCAQQ